MNKNCIEQVMDLKYLGADMKSEEKLKEKVALNYQRR